MGKALSDPARPFVAILGGALAVVLGFLLIPVLSPHHSSEQKMAGKVALNEGKQ